MQQLTTPGLEAVHNIAKRYDVSVDTVISLLAAVANGGGTMAQFHLPELGGAGQWMRGGMTMVGDMFNTGLQNTVANLCNELSNLLSTQQVYVTQNIEKTGVDHGHAWWPEFLGHPSASGGQQNSQYAVFPHVQRLAIHQDGQVMIYDTLDHRIGGVQQQSGDTQPLSFSSQHGTFVVTSLPQVNADNSAQAPSSQLSSDDIFHAIEQLAQLSRKGVLTEQEFETKKAELLARL